MDSGSEQRWCTRNHHRLRGFLCDYPMGDQPRTGLDPALTGKRYGGGRYRFAMAHRISACTLDVQATDGLAQAQRITQGAAVLQQAGSSSSTLDTLPTPGKQSLPFALVRLRAKFAPEVSLLGFVVVGEFFVPIGHGSHGPYGACVSLCLSRHIHHLLYFEACCLPVVGREHALALVTESWEPAGK